MKINVRPQVQIARERSVCRFVEVLPNDVFDVLIGSLNDFDAGTFVPDDI